MRGPLRGLQGPRRVDTREGTQASHGSRSDSVRIPYRVFERGVPEDTFIVSLPLDGSGGLGCEIVEASIDTLDLMGDAVHNPV